MLLCKRRAVYVRLTRLLSICQNQEAICNNIITKDPTTPQVCRYTTLWNVRKSSFRLACQEWGRLTSSSSSREPIKVNSEYYCQHVLRGGLLRDIRARCQRYSWILQQNGTLSHTARNTLTYLRRENVTFIEPDMWPPNSPDLIPVDYAVWGALQQMVYQRRRFTTINQLKQAIVIEWGKRSQRFIDRAIGQWRCRLECVVQQQGGHIEH